MTVDSDLLLIQEQTLKLLNEFLSEPDRDALAAAAAFATTAFRIYRTALSDSDYQQMMESIYNSRDKVIPFRPETLQ